MNSLDDMVAKDPLKLNQYDHQAGGITSSKRLYMYLVGIPTFILLYVIFNILQTIAEAMHGSDSTVTNQFSSEYVASSFDKIQVAMQIIPSQVSENNEVLMVWTDEEDDDDDNYLDTSQVTIGDSYFFYNETDNYFSTLHYSSDYMPVGSAQDYCVNLRWIKRSDYAMYDKYIQVAGQSDCNGASNVKVGWDPLDPTTGLNFKPYK